MRVRVRVHARHRHRFIPHTSPGALLAARGYEGGAAAGEGRAREARWTAWGCAAGDFPPSRIRFFRGLGQCRISPIPGHAGAVPCAAMKAACPGAPPAAALCSGKKVVQAGITPNAVKLVLMCIATTHQLDAT